MKKFPYKTAEKHQALGFVLLGIILLVGLISPAFAGASIIVTGSGPVGEDPDDNWGIIVTGTNPVSTTTTIPYPTYTSHYDSSSTPLVVTSHPPCHGSSCTTTITNPSLSIVSHPPCHDPSCTTTTTNPPCTTTTTCPNTIRYTCNSNYQCVTASNGEFTSPLEAVTH